jgi:hypothetical protein
VTVEPLDAASGAEAVTPAPDAVASVEEEIEIEVWWPKDTGPFRRRVPDKKPQHRGSPPGKKASGDGRKERKDAPRSKPEREPPRPPRKPERPPDPLSPFAVLGSLKARFEKT